MDNKNLPAYITAENIIDLIAAIRSKKGDEDAIKAIFGKSLALYNHTKSAVKILGITNADGCSFTDLGTKLAYSNESEKKELLTKIAISYFPYESLLVNIFKGDNITETTTDDIINFWGKFNYGSTEGNRFEGAKLLMNILQYIDFGEFKVGRGGNKTRIIWNTNAKEKFNDLLEKNRNLIVEDDEDTDDSNIKNETYDNSKEDNNELANDKPAMDAITEMAQDKLETRVGISISPNITINVDMSEWTDDKIKNFFKYAYGIFN